MLQPAGRKSSREIFVRPTGHSGAAVWIREKEGWYYITEAYLRNDAIAGVIQVSRKEAVRKRM